MAVIAALRINPMGLNFGFVFDNKVVQNRINIYFLRNKYILQIYCFYSSTRVKYISQQSSFIKY